MKKLKAFVIAVGLLTLCLCMATQTYAAERTAVDSGITGEVNWTLYDDGELVVSGSGRMGDYDVFVSIPWYSYYDSIQTVTFEPGVTYIGGRAFPGCEKLQTVSIADTVTKIGELAFINCSGLKSVEIPGSVADIEDSAFQGSGLRSVVFGDGVRSIGPRAFQECKALQEIVFSDSVTAVGDYAFFACYSLASVDFGDGVQTIGKHAFQNCENLKTLTFGSGIQRIYANAFLVCNALSDVYIEDPNAWATVTFEQTANPMVYAKTLHVLDSEGNEVTDLVLDSTVKKVAEMAFHKAHYLETVTLPESVTEIGNQAFNKCSALRKVIFSNGLKSLGFGAFGACGNLEEAELPEGIVDIGAEAFYNCVKLKSVNIVSSIKTIGKSAFNNCDGIQTLVIPDTVENIGEYAFYSCGNLTSVTIGSGIHAMGAYAFAGCDKMTELTIAEGLTEIPGSAFSSCTALETLVIPKSVTRICQHAFSNCTALKNVSIGSGVKIIEKNVFAKCKGLETIVIPDNVTTFGAYVFEKCENLRNVTLGSGIDTVAQSMFAGCTSLETIDIPENIRVIAPYAFSQCTGLKSITIPGSIGSIGHHAFIQCTKLKTLYFEGDAPAMDAGMFMGVTATAYYPADNATWTEDVRQNYDGDITWVAVGEAEHTVTWVQATTSLEGNIGLNFYVKLSDSLVSEPTTAMRFVVNGVTMDIPLSQAVKIGGQYKFTCPVSAKNMADTVNAQIVTSAGGVGDAKNLAVMTYCNYMIQYSTDTKLVSLMKAMLNYGAAAQVLFDHNTDNLANASLSEADKALADVDASAYAHSVTGTEEGIQVYNATLLLETETSIRIYFKLTGSKTIDQYTFMVDGEVVQAKPNGSQYYVEIPNIAAQHLDEMHTITVGGITIRYGGLSYVNQVIQNKESLSEALVNTAKALFAYNKLSEVYFN